MNLSIFNNSYHMTVAKVSFYTFLKSNISMRHVSFINSYSDSENLIKSLFGYLNITSIYVRNCKIGILSLYTTALKLDSAFVQNDFQINDIGSSSLIKGFSNYIIIVNSSFSNCSSEDNGGVIIFFYLK